MRLNDLLRLLPPRPALTEAGEHRDIDPGQQLHGLQLPDHVPPVLLRLDVQPHGTGRSRELRLWLQRVRPVLSERPFEDLLARGLPRPTRSHSPPGRRLLPSESGT